VRDLSSVVITGLGAVHPVGCGRQALAAALRVGAARWTTLEGDPGLHRPGGSRLAALAGDADLTPWLSPLAARRMSRPSRLAVAAAKMALEDATPEGGAPPDVSRAAVVVSNAHGPASLIEGILDQVHEEGPLGVSPALFTESVANAPAAQVAITCRIGGPNVTIVQREAGSLLALTQAAAEIARGRAERAVVVAVDELTPLLHGVLDRFRALSPEPPRPFARRRRGFVPAEAAVALVLERDTAAAGRGARPLARMRCGFSGFDPRAARNDWPREAGLLARLLSRRLTEAGVPVDSIGGIVSGASGAVAGDRLEAEVLRRVWGEALDDLPLFAPKGVLGETGGAVPAGAVLALGGVPFAATPGFDEPDPALGVTPHDGRELPPPRRVLATGLAAGGGAAWAVLDAEGL
jgi:3-oxoacyl-[acyl-carrier-protein] synthase II